MALILVFLLLLAGYLVLFYSTPVTTMRNFSVAGAPAFSRFEFQQFLFRHPDFLWQLWTNGDASQCGLWDRLPVLAWTAILMISALLLGRWFVHQSGADRRLTQFESIVFSLGAGLSLLSLFTLAIGLAGLLDFPVIGYIPLAACLLGYGVRRATAGYFFASAEPAQDAASENDTSLRWIRAKGLWFGLPFVVAITLGAMLPPRAFDVREYHLQVPKEWFQQGEITFLEHNIYGNMPLGAEMHALLAMVMTGDWWLGALVGKTVIAMFAPLTALAIFCAGRRLFGAAAGVVGALVFISIPWIAQVSMQGLIEGALSFYLFAAVYAVMIWSQQRTADQQGENTADFGLLLLAGFLAGSAVACKYPALLFVVIPLGIWILVDIPALRGRTDAAASGDQYDLPVSFRIRAVGIFLLAVMLGCGLWLAKNWVFTGNPTYPLMYEVFGGRTLTDEKHEQWTEAHAAAEDDRGRSYSLRQLGDGLAQVLWKSNWLSPLVMPLAACSLLVKRRRGTIVALWGLFVFVVACWWLFTHRIDRFWIPVLPITALLAGVGATWTKERIWQHVLIGMLCWGMVCSLQIDVSRAMDEVRFFVTLEQLRRDPRRPEALIPSRIHPAHQFINTHLPEGFQALMVGNSEPFDLEKPVLYNTCFDEDQLSRLLEGKSKSQRVRELKENKVGLIFVDWVALRRYRAAGNYGYSSDFPTPETFRRLVATGVLSEPLQVFSKAGDVEYEIYSVPSAGFVIKAQK